MRNAPHIQDLIISGSIGREASNGRVVLGGGGGGGQRRGGIRRTTVFVNLDTPWIKLVFESCIFTT